MGSIVPRGVNNIREAELSGTRDERRAENPRYKMRNDEKDASERESCSLVTVGSGNGFLLVDDVADKGS